MGRKPDPEVAKLIQRALAYEQAGLAVAVIAEKVGRHRDTVKGWLRKARGPKQKITYRDRVIGLLSADPHPTRDRVAEMAKATGCSVAHVLRIKREVENSGPASKTDALVGRLVADPTLRNERFVKTGSFGRALVRKCSHSVDLDPLGSKELIDISEELFAGLLQLRRKPNLKRATLCNLVQIKAAKAARVRALRAPKDQPAQRERDLTQALGMVDALELEADNCLFCRADLGRRRAIILRDLEIYDEALSAVQASSKIYEETDDPGHDATGDGYASCGLVESQILLLSGLGQLAFARAETVLRRLPVEERSLRPALFFVVAVSLYLTREREGLLRASELAEEQLRVYGPEPSMPRVRLLWFSGLVFDLLNDKKSAGRHYKLARLDAIDLEFPAAVAAIDAKIGRLEGDASAFRAHLLSLRRYSNKLQKETFPAWLSPIAAELEKSYRTARRDLDEALKILAHAGSSFAPDLA